MATIATRVESDGTFLVNGEFDEFTGAPVVNGDLVFWLDATQTASYPGSGDDWFSLVDAANTAVLANGAAFASTSGGVITFDGTNDLADFSAPGLGTGTAIITVEMWANIKVTGARMPFGFTGYDVYLNGGRLAYNTGNSDQYGISAADYTATNAIGNVAHYCFVMYNNTSRTGITYDNNKIYVNGVAQTLSQQVGLQSNSTRTFNNGAGRISGWRTDNLYRANMDVAVFKIYDRELTAEEVATNFNALAPRYALTPIADTPAIVRTTANTVYAGEFDEQTYTGNSTFARRDSSAGVVYVTDIFDEFTGAPVVNGNLILWLDAGQTNSYPGTGSTWTDLSTNSLNGTLVNTPTFDSQGWIVFDRTQSERVDFGDSASVDFTGTAPYTLEAWVYPLSNYPTQTYAGIFNHESNPGGGRDGWNMWLRGNAAQNTTMTFATERFALGSQNAPSFNLDESVVVNNWHHIVTTYDGTAIRMYRNGNLAVGPSNSSLSITNTTVNLNIASRGTGSYFDGRVSIARIYDRALTADEVSQNFNANRRRYGI